MARDTRNRALAKAREMINSSGIQSFSLRAMAQEIGISAPSLYEHFSSKDAIVAELRDHVRSQLTERLKQHDDLAQQPDQTLLSMVRSYVEFFLEEPHRMSLMFEETYTKSSGITSRLPEPSPYNLLLSAAAAFTEQSGGKEEDAHGLALSLWTYAHGTSVLSQQFLKPIQSDVLASIRPHIERVLSGYSKDVS